MFYGNYRFEGPPKKKYNLVRVFLLVTVLICLLVSIIVIASYLIHSAQNQKAQQEMAAEFHQDSVVAGAAAQTISYQSSPTVVPSTPTAKYVFEATPTLSPTQSQKFFQVVGIPTQEFRSLIRKNPDVIGWITIDGVVDQPVVFRDNTYYMTHDVNRNPNSCGAIFLDEDHPIHEESQNLLIYGHNMKDQSMFGKLQKYLDIVFLRNHYTITFSTRYDTFTYLIFSVAHLSVNPNSQGFLCFWEHPKFENAEAFRSYIASINKHSIFTPYLAVDENDTLLTLVTCDGNDEERLVIFARRQRQSDTPESIRHAQLNLVPR